MNPYLLTKVIAANRIETAPGSFNLRATGQTADGDIVLIETHVSNLDIVAIKYQDAEKQAAWQTMAALAEVPGLDAAKKQCCKVLLGYLYDNGPWKEVIDSMPEISWKKKPGKEVYCNTRPLPWNITLTGSSLYDKTAIEISISPNEGLLSWQKGFYPVKLFVRTADQFQRSVCGTLKGLTMVLSRHLRNLKGKLKCNEDILEKQRHALSWMRKHVHPDIKQVVEFTDVPWEQVKEQLSYRLEKKDIGTLEVSLSQKQPPQVSLRTYMPLKKIKALIDTTPLKSNEKKKEPKAKEEPGPEI
jgi:hypothetical protein